MIAARGCRCVYNLIFAVGEDFRIKDVQVGQDEVKIQIRYRDELSVCGMGYLSMKRDNARVLCLAPISCSNPVCI